VYASTGVFAALSNTAEQLGGCRDLQAVLLRRLRDDHAIVVRDPRLASLVHIASVISGTSCCASLYS
jgi:hypothetical protein